MIEKVEAMIETICGRIGETYTGFHTIGPGVVDGEQVPNVCFHIGDPDDIDARLDGTGGMYYALVGSKKTVLQDAGENFVTEYDDITKDTVFSG